MTPSAVAAPIKGTSISLALSGGLMLLALRSGDQEKASPPSMIGVSMHAAMGLVALLLLVLGYLRA